MPRRNYFADSISRLYSNDYYKDGVRNVTFQVTNDCCCKCSYCYQINKKHDFMTNDITKNIIDLLFNMYQNYDDDSVINHNTKGIVLDFIGGEPLMNLEVIDFACSYFMETCLKLNHDWIKFWRASLISNGKYYFSKNVQNFLKKFNGFLSFAITLDGPKEIHDRCRKYHNNEGNFNDAYAAFKDCQLKFGYNETKVTISPENLLDINTILDFFIYEGVKQINANPIFEHRWTFKESQIFYNELKKIADKNLTLYNDISISLFEENIGHKMEEYNVNTWCGGTGKMLAFDPKGNAYPCLRYMESSLGDSQPPLVIGNCFDGIYNTPETKKIYTDLCSITRRTQSTDECFYCPVASGCSYCSAYNYQCFGTANSRSTNICNMHKARVLANVYYWNLYYEKNNINKVFEMNLPKDDALNFINEKEYNMLLDLVNSRKEKIKTL